jgi:hypothetical protein
MFSSAQALDSWQDALRQQIAWSAAVQEDVRHTYEDEAAAAWDIDVLEVLSGSLTNAAREAGTAGLYAQLEGQGRSSAAGQLRAAYAGTDALLGSGRYELPGGGQDLPRRLADLRATGDRFSADSARADGDASFRRAGMLAAASISLVLVHLLALVIVRIRLRRRRTARGQDLVDVRDTSAPGRGVIATTLKRFGAAIPVLAWVAVTTFPAAQMQYTKQEQRAQTIAASQAVRVSTAIACGGMRAGFSTRSLHTILTLEASSLGSRIAALEVREPEVARTVESLAVAEEPALAELDRIRQAMSRPPTAADGVDPATAEVVGASLADLEQLGSAQRRSADLAGRAGQKADLLSLAIFFAALAGAVRTSRFFPMAVAVRGFSLTCSFILAAWALSG